MDNIGYDNKSNQLTSDPPPAYTPNSQGLVQQQPQTIQREATCCENCARYSGIINTALFVGGFLLLAGSVVVLFVLPRIIDTG